MAGGGNPIAFTGHAMSALKLSISFSTVFQKALTVPVVHRLDLDTPPGTSTGGGENVKQTVKLVVGKTNAIAIGTANAAGRTAEIFAYDATCATFARANAGAPFPFDAEQYAALVARLEAFFKQEKIVIGAAPKKDEPAPTPEASPAKSRVVPLVIVGAIVIAIVVVELVSVLR